LLEDEAAAAAVSDAFAAAPEPPTVTVTVGKSGGPPSGFEGGMQPGGGGTEPGGKSVGGGGHSVGLMDTGVAPVEGCLVVPGDAVELVGEGLFAVWEEGAAVEVGTEESVSKSRSSQFATPSPTV